MTEKKVPHVHAEMIKAWAEGAIIQYKCPSGWKDVVCSTPTWGEFETYRVKPEPKPDVILYACIEKNDWKSVMAAKVLACNHTCNADIRKTPSDTVMFVFDGETGKLKDAQVLAQE